MNLETLATDKLTDEEYVRDLEERRREHIRCAELLGDRIRVLLDMRAEYERHGSYVVDAPASTSRHIEDTEERAAA